MSKNHKLTYAVNETNTKVIIINKTNTVSDVLDIIQKNEKDNEYKHLFYDGAEINQDEILFEFYDQQAVYIASKTESIPNDLYTTLTTLSKSNIQFQNFLVMQQCISIKLVFSDNKKNVHLVKS